MIFKRIELNDFRQYYGDQEIEFASGGERNVTIIHGANGAGKTSLFNAINWCLYNEGVEGIGALVSKEEALKYPMGKELVTTVKIWFEHRGTTYVAIRKAGERKVARKDVAPRQGNNELSKYRDFTLQRLPPEESDFVVYEERAGGMHPLPDPNLLIDSALPQNARQYFLFDGEKIEKLTKPDHDKEVKEAVCNILQLPAIENVIDHLDNVLKEITRESRKQSSGNEEEHYAAITKQESHKDKINHDVAELENNFKATRKLKELVEADLSKLASVRHLIARRQDLEGQLRRAKEESGRLKVALRNMVSSSYVVLAQSMVGKGLEVLREKKKQKLIPPPVQESFVKSILDAGACICGNDLREGTHGRECLLDFITRCARFSQTSQQLSDLLGDLEVINANASHLSKNILTTMKQILSLESNIETLSRSVEEVHYELKSQPESDIAELETKRRGLDREEQAIRTKIAELQTLLKICDANIKRITEELEKIAKTKTTAKKYLTLRDLSEKALEVMKRVYEVFASEKREEIELKMRDIFQSLIWKDSQFPVIKLTDDYKLEVYDLYGSPAREELSAGERQVLSLSFITAMALVSGGKIPLVMDTPFGRLFSIHRENIAEQIPKLTNQWILMVQDEELTGNALKKLSPKVGAEYRLTFENGCTTIGAV
ncbi:MAG: AAA family ATPase [Syntrophobacteraceae bacterium]